MTTQSPLVDPSGEAGAAILQKIDSSSSPTGTPSGDVSATISSLGQLKSESPKVYQAMMLGIAINICNQSQNSQQRIREMMQEERAESDGF